MKRTLVLAKLFFLGCLRRQAHLATLFLAVILLMLPAYVNSFSLGMNAFERVSKDFGLTLITYFTVGMTLLLASTSIPRDLESRSVYPILARPIFRIEYILAHLLAVLYLLFWSLLFLSGALTVALAGLSHSLDLSIFVAVGTLYLQLAILAALTIAISTVASPALAGTAGAFVYLVGSLPAAFIRFFLVEDRNSAISSNLASALKAVLPNLSLFNLKEAVVHQIEFNWLYLPSLLCYALIWIAGFVLLGAILFGKKDL